MRGTRGTLPASSTRLRRPAPAAHRWRPAPPSPLPDAGSADLPRGEFVNLARIRYFKLTYSRRIAEVGVAGQNPPDLRPTVADDRAQDSWSHPPNSPGSANS